MLVFLLTLRPHFQNSFLSTIFLFPIVNSKMPRDMCTFRHKVRNGHFYPMKVQILSISKRFFQIKLLI